MRELSLFSGAGGGLLATKHLLGWETVGYVEFNDYCQRVIAARIKDGLLDNAPIFGDIRAFISSGSADLYRGPVDVVSGGFPCQPFSCAGKRAGADDPRNMWPATLEVIRIIRPRWAFLENVRGLLSSGYFPAVLEGLSEVGMDARWGVWGAGDYGADHERNRLWLVADAQGFPILQLPEAHENPDAERQRQSGQGQCRASIGHAASPFRQTDGLINAVYEGALPYVCREHHGLADGVDRLTALGGGWVPIVAASAWRILSGLG